MEIYRKRYIPEEDLKREAAQAEQRKQQQQQRKQAAAESSPALSEAQGEHGEGTGITLEGIRRAISMLTNQDQINAKTTTSTLCKVFIQPLTVAEGWTAEAELILLDDKGQDVSANKWYSHTYINKATGDRHPKQPPPGTRSMCQVLSANPENAKFVGRPTHFLSHGARPRRLSVYICCCVSLAAFALCFCSAPL